jgi:alkylation response protein AidB-like acyl-CoA dehydrogenase
MVPCPAPVADIAFAPKHAAGLERSLHVVGRRGGNGLASPAAWGGYGEHDLTDNIIHFVLARLPDAPVGTKGISLFLVPKFLLNKDGSLAARNDVRAHSVEHKMGIHASPTCTMVYGDHGGAIGFLIGEEHKGMAAMFTMMNRARLAVALQGVAIAERATQHAMAYARDRKQSGIDAEPAVERAGAVLQPAKPGSSARR